MSLRDATKNIRKSGLTVKGWATRNGFNYETAIKVINGQTGKRQIGIAGEIIKQLKADGFC